MAATYRCIVAGLFVSAMACAEGNETAGDPMESLELLGSFQLVVRESPDGSTLEPPDIFGFMTYTDGHRHFHLHYRNADGAPVSGSFRSYGPVRPSLPIDPG